MNSCARKSTFSSAKSLALAPKKSTSINFYSSNFPEYYWQKGHYNLGNKIIHSDLYKSLNPIRAHYDYNPNNYSQMPYFLGHVPQTSWVYGNLDYSFNKYHRHY